MALQDDLRAQLIKQFAADVVEITEESGNVYYGCPTCKRPVSRNNGVCSSCGQNLNWDNISKEEYKKVGMKTATLSFEVPGDFIPVVSGANSAKQSLIAESVHYRISQKEMAKICMTVR